MIDEIKEVQNRTRTENGAAAFVSSLDACVDLFFRIGALRLSKPETVEKLFVRAFAEDPDMALRAAFYARDARGGLGERRTFRLILKWLARHEPESVRKNIALVPEFGRYDDLLMLLGTPAEADAVRFLKEKLAEDEQALSEGKNVSLLAKWLPSVNASSPETKTAARFLARQFGMREETYRKKLSALRSRIGLLETALVQKADTFDYEKMPSRALFCHRAAFLRRDPDRFNAFVEAVREEKKRMHAACIYPYEVVRALLATPGKEERAALDAVWQSLPDFTDDTNALAVVDGSASMYWRPVDTAGTLPAHVALSLGLYLAERSRGAFRNHFITFSSRPRLVEIKGRDLSERVEYCMTYNECANTDLAAVFRLLLDTAVEKGLPQSDLPQTLYVISDMEFDHGVDADVTVFQEAKAAFEAAGYRLPAVVFWNVQSRHGVIPVTKHETGAALVSGLSPTVFRIAMSRQTDPVSFMRSVLENGRYSRVSA